MLVRTTFYSYGSGKNLGVQRVRCDLPWIGQYIGGRTDTTEPPSSSRTKTVQLGKYVGTAQLQITQAGEIHPQRQSVLQWIHSSVGGQREDLKRHAVWNYRDCEVRGARPSAAAARQQLLRGGSIGHQGGGSSQSAWASNWPTCPFNPRR